MTRPRVWGIVLVFGVLMALGASARADHSATLVVKAGDEGLSRAGGVLLFHGEPFDGTLEERQGDGGLTSTPYRSGLRDGTARAFYPDGSPRWERSYRRGLEEGTHRGWWEDGTPSFDYHYQNGALEGVAREFYPDGSPYREQRYQAGQEYGQQRMYELDGKLRANYVVKNGRRYGLMGTKGCVADALTQEVEP